MITVNASMFDLTFLKSTKVQFLTSGGEKSLERFEENGTKTDRKNSLAFPNIFEHLELSNHHQFHEFFLHLQMHSTAISNCAREK